MKGLDAAPKMQHHSRAVSALDSPLRRVSDKNSDSNDSKWPEWADSSAVHHNLSACRLLLLTDCNFLHLSITVQQENDYIQHTRFADSSLQKRLKDQITLK